jgi:hypothetical protein
MSISDKAQVDRPPLYAMSLDTLQDMIYCSCNGLGTNMQEFTITVRISATLRDRLDKATSGPYAPSQSAIVRRGIELALSELERREKGRK